MDGRASSREGFEQACARVLEACAHGLPARRLSSCAVVTDAGRTHLPARERQERKGPYPLYVRGDERVGIDDYAYEGDALLVGACGAVSTREGKLFVVRATGRFSVSELYHVVLPDVCDAAYVEAVLSAVDAGRLAKGTSAVRVVELSALRGMILPWPEASVRALLVEALAACGRAGEEGERSARHIMRAWFESARSVGPLSNVPALPQPCLIKEPVDHSDDVLAVADGLLDALGASGSELLDVVDATENLADPNIPRTARFCVCFPPPNQGAWTDRAVCEADARWFLGAPPRSRANFAWVQQTLACMENGGAAVLLVANAVLHTCVGREAALRRALARSGLVSAVISLPGGLFSDGRPPSSFVVLNKPGRTRGALLVDALGLGVFEGATPSGAVCRSLPSEVVARIVEAFAAWLAEDVRALPPFCRVVSEEELDKHDGVLSPWVYVRRARCGAHGRGLRPLVD
ncbi:hypothetical protein B5F40_00710 [Gordonibacter sp. An230]|uniref:N-6 DNA methylase n=1 Tax=Gordonibacter sp. An230 TaxID=1965592 RepID=UPI000B3821DF|nr:N-6 DNA methylase [Gordonibacter sp. An230]OUO92453.1 hypothetical protein B5F40_00710 [Gordonibacter sp. An230]